MGTTDQAIAEDELIILSDDMQTEDLEQPIVLEDQLIDSETSDSNENIITFDETDVANDEIQLVNETPSDTIETTETDEIQLVDEAPVVESTDETVELDFSDMGESSQPESETALETPQESDNLDLTLDVTEDSVDQSPLVEDSSSELTQEETSPLEETPGFDLSSSESEESMTLDTVDSHTDDESMNDILGEAVSKLIRREDALDDDISAVDTDISELDKQIKDLQSQKKEKQSEKKSLETEKQSVADNKIKLEVMISGK